MKANVRGRISNSARLRRRAQAEKQLTTLSNAERRVFDFLLDGLSASEIASKLKISPFTVSNHTRKIFEKFGVSSRSAVLASFVVPPEEA